LLLAISLCSCAPPVSPEDVTLTFQSKEAATVQVNGKSLGQAPLSLSLTEVAKYFIPEWEDACSSGERMLAEEKLFRAKASGSVHFGSGLSTSSSHEFHHVDMTDKKVGTTIILLRYKFRGDDSELAIAGGFEIALIAEDGTRLNPTGVGSHNEHALWDFSR